MTALGVLIAVKDARRGRTDYALGKFRHEAADDGIGPAVEARKHQIFQR